MVTTNLESRDLQIASVSREFTPISMIQTGDKMHRSVVHSMIHKSAVER